MPFCGSLPTELPPPNPIEDIINYTFPPLNMDGTSNKESKPSGDDPLTPTDDTEWHDQLAKYNSIGMLDGDIVREHRAYVRKVHMMKSLTRKFIKLFEYFLT